MKLAEEVDVHDRVYSAMLSVVRLLVAAVLEVVTNGH